VAFFEEHLERLRRSAGKLAIAVPWDDAEIRVRVESTARASGKDDVYFRIVLSRGEISHVGLEVESETPPTLVVIVQDLPAGLGERYEKGVRLLTSSIIRNPAAAQDPNIKTSNYLNSLLALRDARGRGADDAVMCNGAGQLTEGTTFSVFGVTAAGGLITPSLSIGILDSITRRHVLQVAAGRMPTEEGIFSLSVFHECREIFIASSVREIVPVHHWDGRDYPAGGPATRLLQKALREYIEAYVASHSRY